MMTADIVFGSITANTILIAKHLVLHERTLIEEYDLDFVLIHAGATNYEDPELWRLAKEELILWMEKHDGYDDG
jgi:hypothetical protein